VFDMPTSIKLYCEALGFQVVSSDRKPAPHFDWVLLERNGIELMLNTAYDADDRPPVPDASRIAAHGDTVTSDAPT
jgi:glyoxylase I family protein